MPVDELRVVLRQGAPVVEPARAVADAARWAGSVEEALVVIDAALAFGVTRQSQITDALSATSAPRGRPQARRALDLSEIGVESPWESRLRYCWVVEAGLPRPLVNPRIVDAQGRFLGRSDLFDPDAGLVGEFDGRHHRERRQHRLDNLREEGFESVNLVVVRIDSLDLGPDRRTLVTRLQAAHRRGLGRARHRDRWRVVGREERYAG